MSDFDRNEIIETIRRNARRWEEARTYFAQQGWLDKYLMITEYDHIETARGVEPCDYRTAYRANRYTREQQPRTLRFGDNCYQGGFDATLTSVLARDFLDRMVDTCHNSIEWAMGDNC